MMGGFFIDLDRELKLVLTRIPPRNGSLDAFP